MDDKDLGNSLLSFPIGVWENCPYIAWGGKGPSPIDMTTSRDASRCAVPHLRVVRCGSLAEASGLRSKIPARAFSLIDMLVSIAVMGVLISILLPSLTHAQEAARRVKCASNTRQIGLSIQAYAYEHQDLLPPLLNAQSSSSSTSRIASGGPVAQAAYRPEGMNHWSNDSMYVRWATSSAPTTGRSTSVWDGIGLLFTRDFLDVPEVVYCPSHHGRHSFEAYAAAWSTGEGTIASNYQYRMPRESRHLSTLSPRISFLADGLQTRTDYNHVRGNNFLRADLAVLWYEDVNGVLSNSLPQDGEDGVANDGSGGGGDGNTSSTAWEVFDKHK